MSHESPQQQAVEVIAAHFQDDPAAMQAAEQIAAALDEALLLIDPIEHALYQHLREGKMTAEYEEGRGLLWKITPKGERVVEAMGGSEGREPSVE